MPTRAFGPGEGLDILNGTHVSIHTAFVKHSLKLEDVNRRRYSPTRAFVLHAQPVPSIISGPPRVHDCGEGREIVMASNRTGVGPLSDDTEAQQQTTGGGGLVGRLVAFTTPLQYATRFGKFVRDEGAEPLWCPTIVTQQTEKTRHVLEVHLGKSSSSEFHGVAFTSRTGIRAIADALDGRQLPCNSHGLQNPIKPFVVAALGKDAELLHELNVVADNPRVSKVVPAVSTPQALVEALGNGNGRKILCPVPLFEGLEEPPVVPQFLQQLSRQGWDPVRVNSYVTRWLGGDCAKALLVDQEPTAVRFRSLDALVFTSTAEIEGLLKSCASLGLDGVEALQKGSRRFLVACHGPVTALGAQRLGVAIDVVGEDFQSFAGVINALEAEFGKIAHTKKTRL